MNHSQPHEKFGKLAIVSAVVLFVLAGLNLFMLWTLCISKTALPHTNPVLLMLGKGMCVILFVFFLIAAVMCLIIRQAMKNRVARFEAMRDRIIQERFR